jgi:DNA-binding NtrC family response regulator
VIERVVLLETKTIIDENSLNFLNPSIIDSLIKENFDNKETSHFVKVPKEGVSLHIVMKDLIEQTLNLTNGDKIKAAEILQISIAQLEHRIKQLNINI